MKRIFALLLILLLLGACSGQTPDGEPSSEPTSLYSRVTVISDSLQYGNGTPITVVSNNVEYEPYGRFICSFDGEMFADGFQWIDSAVELLPEIPYAKDFQVLLSERCKVAEYTTRYTLYDDNLEQISSGDGVDNFTFPEEAGLYFLSIDLTWRQDEKYNVCTHDFKIRK